MEQHCRGEYERSFLLNFQEVSRPFLQDLWSAPSERFCLAVVGAGTRLAGESLRL